MTDADYKTELETELALLNTAIQHIIQTGDSYEIGSSSHKRVFSADLEKWRKIRNGIRLELKQYETGTDDYPGIILGASW